MKLIDKLFSENSSISIMRIMAIMSLIAGIVLAIIGKPSDIVCIFVYAAFGGKAIQRYFESKEVSDSSHPKAPQDLKTPQ